MQNQQKVKAFELRKQDETALVNNLNKFRAELVGLRTSKVSSAPQVKLARIRVSILTIVRSNTLFRHLVIKASVWPYLYVAA
jgi:ribosomal protein L29